MGGLKILKLTWIDVMSLDTSLVFPDELDDIKPCKVHIDSNTKSKIISDYYKLLMIKEGVEK